MTTVLEDRLEEEDNNNRRKQIAIENSVYERLKKHGEFGMTYSELISNVLDKVEGREVNPEERSF